MTASTLLDVCRFNPTAGSTTDWTVSTAVTGYQTPAQAGATNGIQVSYRAESADLLQWEVGMGVYNSSTGVVSRAAVLFNSAGTTAKINFSAVPQVSLVALAEDLVTSIGGASGAITLTSGLSINGHAVVRALNEATVQTSAVTNAAITSTAALMQGLGSSFKITPVYSTRVKVEAFGIMSQPNNGTGTATLQFGTGAAPANNGALSGTQIGAPIVGGAGNSSAPTLPFGAGGIITGLTPGIQYWFDFSFKSSGTSMALQQMCGNAFEF